MLDDLDVELERRGLRFARYADDLLIFVRSQQAARRVLRSLSRFIEGRLRLRINPSKSKATRLNACSFLGFELRRGQLHWTDAAVQRFKERVREITNRSNGRSMTSRIEALKRYVSDGSTTSATAKAMRRWSNWTNGSDGASGCATGNSGSGRARAGAICWPWGYRVTTSNWPRGAARDTGAWRVTASSNVP